MAGNARFHNKYHRANHHTNPSLSIPDSASDPIASPEFPFQGNFIINGSLSANNFLTSGLSGVSTTVIIGLSSFQFTKGILTQVQEL
jgi:hypothetical protein